MDLTTETFLVRHGVAGPQTHDHMTRRIAELGHHPRIVRWNVNRETPFHMVAQNCGVTRTTESTTAFPVPGIVFRTITDEPEKVDFHAYGRPITVVSRFVICWTWPNGCGNDHGTDRCCRVGKDEDKGGW